ncbi:MAG: RagB/SusD family nutrient uptake outer membrane protein [Chitinophagaceae bacterium]|nr:RagB/SusD family nutrient uptake outer membrane protein [Chitinophagaceae bacterium]
MKKQIIFLAAVVLLVTACNKKLDINPTQSVPQELVFDNNANILAALNGAYDVASDGYVLGGDLMLYSELLGAGDEITWVGTYNEPREIYNKSILTNNLFVANTWSLSYRVINICNNIIANISKVNEDDRDRVHGEALFLRGLMYFGLAELYAKPYSAGNLTTNLGLQLVTSPTVNGQVTSANLVPRSSVQDTYAQILADLTTAKPLLNDEIGVFASKYAAAAILSRVYLQMGDYAKARDEANEVIENSGASLTTTYVDAFNNADPSSEDIFVLPVTAQDGTNDMWLFWSTGDYGARDGDVEVNQEHLDLYDPADQRLALFWDVDDIYYSGKYRYQYRFLSQVRLAEMILTRAECNEILSTVVGASPVDDFNAIRNRAGLGTVGTVTLDEILFERHLELAHEGQRINDIKRLKQSIEGFDYDANELVLPIPLREINAVGADILQQNDGY